MTALHIRALDVPVSELGEGPLWRADEGALHWIDIRADLLHRWSESEGYTGAIALPATPGCVVDGADGSIVVAVEAGLIAVDPRDGRITRLVSPTREGGRYNDGAVDPAGRLWVGTIESAPGAADGVLYRIERGGSATVMRRGLVVPNGIDFAPDGRTMYFTITELDRVLAFDYDPATGDWAAERELLRDEHRSPDGLVVAADGSVWSAKWSGAAIQQVGPDGAALREVGLPVTNVTSAAFGGDDLATLFVTTAVDEPGGTASERPEWAGRVLAIDGLGVTGSPLPAFESAPEESTA